MVNAPRTHARQAAICRQKLARSPAIALAIILLTSTVTFLLAESGGFSGSSRWTQILPQKDGIIGFIVPWRNPGHAGPELPPSDETSPECPRTLLYTFAGSHGFASEYLIFLRVALLAKHYDYQVFIDDTRWNYGRWADYFKPVQHSCRIPLDVNRTALAPHPLDLPLSALHLQSDLSSPSWTYTDHVAWSTRKIEYLDELILHLFVDSQELAKLHQFDRQQWPPAVPLGPDQVLPYVFRDIYERMAELLKELWTPSPELQVAVDQGHSLLDPHSAKASCGTFAAHVRHGDKSLELSKFGPQAWSALSVPTGVDREITTELQKKSAQDHEDAVSDGMDIIVASGASEVVNEENSLHIVPASPSAYLTGAADALKDCDKRSRPSVSSTSPAEKAKLILLSDDDTDDGLRAFFLHEKSHMFDIWRGISDGFRSVETAKSTTTRASALQSSAIHAMEPASPVAGFNEAIFNASPMEERVSVTRGFLRDLTLLAQYADGLVITATSNVGRLFALLAYEGLNPAANIYSVDVRWFPTARYQ